MRKKTDRANTLRGMEQNHIRQPPPGTPLGHPAEADLFGLCPNPQGPLAPDPIFFSHASPLAPLAAPPFLLTTPPQPAILRARMENQTTNIDLSALDTEAMRSRLSELGSYL